MAERKDNIPHVLERLAGSAFRRRFRLKGRELAYFREKGKDVIMSHAADFIEKRLAPALPDNDGKQTPMRNHPIFIAQHATATCCRGCLKKWHRIPEGQALTVEEKQFVLDLIAAWLDEQSRV